MVLYAIYLLTLVAWFAVRARRRANESRWITGFAAAAWSFLVVTLGGGVVMYLANRFT